MGSGALLVIGEDVEGQMARFRNFENTGWVDQHVVTIDRLAHEKARWLRDSQVEGWYVRDPEGKLHELFERSPSGKYLFTDAVTVDWDDDSNKPHTLEQEVFGRESYIDMTEFNQKRMRMVIKVPEGFKVTKAKRGEFQTFAETLRKSHGVRAIPEGEAPDLNGTDKFGWMRLDHSGEAIELMARTIPGGFWFPYWGVIPNAWTLKAGALGARDPDTADDLPGFSGSARRSEINFDAMRSRIAIEAGESWDRARADPGAYDKILIGGAYYRQHIRLPREQYTRAIEDLTLWRGSLLMGGEHIKDAPDAFKAAHALTPTSVNAWFAYINQLIVRLPDDSLMTMVGYRC